jgi:hypothetical protein
MRRDYNRGDPQYGTNTEILAEPELTAGRGPGPAWQGKVTEEKTHGELTDQQVWTNRNVPPD